ncbi:MAG: glycosyltransferase [Deltaproteobacteria bacterium]|nr:glycosyltransferase [Deltaproteobacteria bacterium]
MAPPAQALNGNNKPVCSICIANYNGVELLGECLDAVFSQNVEFPFEVVVHDDASTDESVAFITANYSKVRIIKTEVNVGFCVSNNRMVSQAQGDFILLLNNDAILYPDALQTCWVHARQIGKQAIIGLPQYDAITGELIDQGNLFDPFLNPIPNKDSNRQHVGMVVGACLWIPKSLWEQLNGFPEWFGSNAEDMYLCCRAHLAGYSVIALPLSGYRHYVGQSFGGGKLKDNQLSTTYKRRSLSERNKSYVMVLIYPPFFFQIIFPLHIISLLCEGIILAILNRRVKIFSDIYLNALKELWRNRHLLKKGRNDIIQNTVPGARRRFYQSIVIRLQKLAMIANFGLPSIR